MRYKIRLEGPGTIAQSGRGKRNRDCRHSNEGANLNGRAFKQTRRDVLGKIITNFIDRAITLVAPPPPALPRTVDNIAEHNHEELSTLRNRGGCGDSSVGHQTREEDDRYRCSRNSRPSVTPMPADGCNIRELPIKLLSEPYPEGPPEGRALVSYGVRHVGIQTEHGYSRKTTEETRRGGSSVARHVLEKSCKTGGAELVEGVTTGNHEKESIAGNERDGREDGIGGDLKGDSGHDVGEGNYWIETCKCGRSLSVYGGTSWAGTCRCGRSLLISDECTNITVREVGEQMRIPYS